MKQIRLLLFLGLGLLPFSGSANWWQDARFGMFIHWGPDAIPSLHWNKKPWNKPGQPVLYPAHESILQIPAADWKNKVIRQFNPAAYNPDEWAAIAQKAGMKYGVLTVKHHNGFCLWPGNPGYDIRNTGYPGDPVKEYVQAFRKKGLKVGFYFSQLDWYDKDAVGNQRPKTYPDGWMVNPAAYLDKIKKQLKDLLTRYGTIDILWFDGDWIPDWKKEYGDELTVYIKSISPTTLINDRVGKRSSGCGDFATPEQYIPENFKERKYWESCMTMNDTWFYVKQDNNWKHTRTLVANLIASTAANGNYLLNVGPDAAGRIPVESIKRLDSIGKWMAINKEAIYGAGKPAFECSSSHGLFTWNKSELYFHAVSGTAKAIEISIPGQTIQNISVVGYPHLKPTFKKSGDAYTIEMPAALQAVLIPVFKITTDKTTEQARKTKRFFGFHFDFHATEKESMLGQHFDTSSLAFFLNTVQPDYIQIDSKGHPGISSYPTNIGTAVKAFQNDPIQLFRKVSEKRKIPLNVHHSGLWDEKATALHPHWARMYENGSYEAGKLSLASGYTDSLLIPQLQELITRYRVDGFWLDGDCWVTGPDYRPEYVNKFSKAFGLTNFSSDIKTTHGKEWLNYHRYLFTSYLEKTISTLKTANPFSFNTSNWAYSSMMPDPVLVDLDYLSGDVSGRNNLYTAAFQAKCLARQGVPWDLMSWGFVPIDFMGGIHSPKSSSLLLQEAGHILSMGGGFELYYQQNRDGSFRLPDTSVLLPITRHVRKIEPLIKDAVTVPQVAIWYSRHGWEANNGGVYGWGSELEGINSLLMDCQYSTEIIMDHQWNETLEEYPLIVIPEWTRFDPLIEERMLNYVKDGGNLILIGAKTSRYFQDLLPVEFQGTDSVQKFNFGFGNPGNITGIIANLQKVIPKSAASVQPQAYLYSQRDSIFRTPWPLTTIHSMGKGKIGVVYADLAHTYKQYKHPLVNQLITSLVDAMQTGNLVAVKGSPYVHVNVTRTKEKQLIHLINASGEHAHSSVLSYNQLLPIPDIEIIVPDTKKPETVLLQPENQVLPFEWKDNRLRIKVPSLGIHSIVEIN